MWEKIKDRLRACDGPDAGVESSGIETKDGILVVTSKTEKDLENIVGEERRARTDGLLKRWGI